MLRILLLGLAALFLVENCVTHQSTDGPSNPENVKQIAGGNSGSEGDECPCRDYRQAVDIDEIPEGFDFSAAEIFEFIGRSHTLPIRWKTQDLIGLEAVDSTLTITVEPGSGQTVAISCSDPDNIYATTPYMEIPVILSLRTDDGLLDERLDGRLIANPPGGSVWFGSCSDCDSFETKVDKCGYSGNCGDCTSHFLVDANKLTGTLGAKLVDSFASESDVCSPVRFGIRFIEQGPTGEISGPASPLTSDCCSSTYAVWPADAECLYNERAKRSNPSETDVYIEAVSGIYQTYWFNKKSYTDTSEPYFAIETDFQLEISLHDETTCHDESSMIEPTDEWAKQHIAYISSNRADVRLGTSDNRINITAPAWLYRYKEPEKEKYYLYTNLVLDSKLFNTITALLGLDEKDLKELGYPIPSSNSILSLSSSEDYRSKEAGYRGKIVIEPKNWPHGDEFCIGSDEIVSGCLSVNADPSMEQNLELVCELPE